MSTPLSQPKSDSGLHVVKLTPREMAPFVARFPMVPTVRIVRLALTTLQEKLDAEQASGRAA